MTVSPLVLILGGGELASACAHALFQCHVPVVILELSQPRVVRRLVSFANVIFEPQTDVEGVPAILCTLREVRPVLESKRGVPVVVDEHGKFLPMIAPDVVIDARMRKRPLKVPLSDVYFRIGLGPGFTAGVDVDVVIETMRGPELGRIYHKGHALNNTGIPGEILGFSIERVIRAPVAGYFFGKVKIGELVEEGDTLGYVESEAVRSNISGLLRGLLYDGIHVKRGQKLGDVDPRGRDVIPRRISDKGRTVAGSVLEVIFSHFNREDPRG